MRIAVIGSGIAGLASAWLLSQACDGEPREVVLYEANDYLGGHTHTHDIELHGRRYAIDSGFIVHNPTHYPLLTRFFEQLGVASQPTTMSFAVRNDASGLEYNATDLDGLFCQRRNLLSPRFWSMLRDLLRFYREAPALLALAGEGPTLGDYLAEHRYGAMFRDEHLVPMASALWSSPSAQILRFPAKYLVQFMANHQMLQISGRPQWRVVRGGSNSYVRALRARWRVQERLNTPVRMILRDGEGVTVIAEHDIGRGSIDGIGIDSIGIGRTGIDRTGIESRGEHYDHVVLACHSDQALRLLGDATDAEREILGAMAYQANDTVLHTDVALLPRKRKAWAAWNALIPNSAQPREGGDVCTVSYCMNLLQGVQSPETFVVTLNRTDAIDPAKILRRMRYEHPVYSHASVAAQERKAEIQGRNRTWFAGAYWGWGFHEDGMRSAVEVAEAFGSDWRATAGGNAEDMQANERNASVAGAHA
jgi:uncharacterized protein